MSTLSFDNVNALGSRPGVYSKRRKSIPIDRYFDEMPIPEEDKEERKEFAREMELLMLYIFAYIAGLGSRASLYRDVIIEDFRQRYLEIAGRYVVPDDYIYGYLNEITTRITDETLEGIQEDDGAATVPDDQDGLGLSDAAMLIASEEYLFSEDRALLIGENEANTILNYADFERAKADGKTHKTWKAILDNRTRNTHVEANGTTIPIDEYFEVGDYLMRFPHDTENAGPEEIVNCRCGMEYRSYQLAKANALFVNKNERLFRNAKKIKPIAEYEDFTCHADPDNFIIDLVGKGNPDDYIYISPKEYAQRIKNSSAYKGGNVRIISCQVGAKQDGAAQQLANELGKQVLAPTEIVNVDENGEIFLCDNEILANMWYTSNNREEFYEPGSWVVFYSKPKSR